MDQQTIERLIKEILGEVNKSGAAKDTGTSFYGSSNRKVGVADYPLGTKRQDLLRTPTNKTLSDITLQNVMNGSITADDVRITPEVLELQAQVAEDAGRPSLAKNFRRAAELTRVPDDRLLEVYNALRPFRSTKSELLAIANEFESQYNAVINANLIREAADIYEKRKKLRVD